MLTNDFQEKMFAKIREQMGDLLTSEDLKPLVEQGMVTAVIKTLEDRMKQPLWNLVNQLNDPNRNGQRLITP